MSDYEIIDNINEPINIFELDNFNFSEYYNRFINQVGFFNSNKIYKNPLPENVYDILINQVNEENVNISNFMNENLSFKILDNEDKKEIEKYIDIRIFYNRQIKYYFIINFWHSLYNIIDLYNYIIQNKEKTNDYRIKIINDNTNVLLVSIPQQLYFYRGILFLYFE